jgi:hypothetical protein
VLFAAVTYAQRQYRWPLFLAGVCFVGPKILLLAPLWWAGVWIYKCRWLRSIHFFGALSAFVASLILTGCYFYFDVKFISSVMLRSLLSSRSYVQLAGSQNFPSDYFLGVAVVFNFIGARAISPALYLLLRPVARAIRYLASCTFSLYLLHQPLLLFFSALISAQEWTTENRAIIIFGLTVVSVLLIAQFTEHKKTTWQRLISFAWNFCSSRIRHWPRILTS